MPNESCNTGSCLYIDTELTFRPERLIDIAQRYGLDPEEVLNNVVCGRAFNVDHQTELVIKAGALLAEAKYGLVVVSFSSFLGYNLDRVFCKSSPI